MIQNLIKRLRLVFSVVMLVVLFVSASFLTVGTVTAVDSSVPSMRIVQEDGVDGGYKLVFEVTASVMDVGEITNFNVIFSYDSSVVVPVNAHTGVLVSDVSESFKTSMTLLPLSWNEVGGRAILSVTTMTIGGVDMSGGYVVVEFYFRYVDGVSAVDVNDSAFALVLNPVGGQYMVQLGSIDGTSYYYGYTEGNVVPVIDLLEFTFGLPKTTYMVSYNANNGLNAPTDSNGYYVSGISVTVLGHSNMVRNGFTFNGWAANSTLGTVYHAGDSFIITGDTVFYAVWTENQNSSGGIGNPTYSVTYDATDGTGVPTDNVKYAQGVTVTILQDVPVRDGYTFAGWLYNEVTYSGGDTFTMPTNDVTLTAQWINGALTTYMVIYNTNNGVNAPIDSNSPYTSSTTVTVLGQSNMTRYGYTFNGWTANSTTGQTYAVSNTFIITGNTTLYAIWTETATPTPSNGNNGGTTAQTPTVQPTSTPIQTSMPMPTPPSILHELMAGEAPHITEPEVDVWSFWKIALMVCIVLMVSVALAIVGVTGKSLT